MGKFSYFVYKNGPERSYFDHLLLHVHLLRKKRFPSRIITPASLMYHTVKGLTITSGNFGKSEFNSTMLKQPQTTFRTLLPPLSSYSFVVVTCKLFNSFFLL
ncbi:unnamed protein product [Lactuca virosa]|uniref:Uncharacterized protein n=1 Tax=Lactuca virosa TaxID=75947 RepID=A0AAU9PKK7_9ASTR|nr:unnamed protein product [Lactuca virosa]